MCSRYIRLRRIFEQTKNKLLFSHFGGIKGDDKMKNWIRNTVLMILLLLASIGRGQNYPVQAFVQLTPPYSSYLPDYSDPFNNQLKVLLTLTDFSVPSYQVKLRLRIEGQGYTIQSADLTNFPAILLSPGVPVEISGSDLAPYLATQNLIFNGIDVANYEQSKILPEGPATICIEVVDIPTGAILGNESCAQSWFYKHQTPLLNLPICGSEITPTSPQSVMFQWTPMHMSIGQNTNYQFELFKVYPEGDDPNVVVSNPFLKIADITTSNTFVLYDLTNTPLEIGEEYVWRIRASDITGRDLFNNSGYSQVCTFTYGNVAGSLLDGYNIQLNSVGTSKRQGKATWNTSGIIDEYILEVRKTGNPNYQWFPYPTTNGELKVNNLEPETEYECRVKGKLAEAETDWSNTSVFTTLAQQDYACNNEAIPGLPPVFKPASSVGTGNIVQVGQFEMIVASAQPSGIQGSFTGEGVIFIPFMMMPLAVEFENVMIDENLTVHAGRVNAITKGVAAWVNEGVTHSIPGTVDSYTSDQQDSIVVFYFGNESLEFDWPTPGNTVTVTDESNKQYVIDEYGNVTESYIIEYDSESLDATANYQVIFKEASSDQFGFDEKEYDPWTLFYPCILLSDSSKYFTSYKAIKDGQTDQVKAELISDQSATTITFKDEDGSTYSSSVAGNTYTIDLNTLSDPEYLYAYDNNGLKLGKLNLIVYEQKDIDVVLVPVNGATATNDANLTSYLNNIYRAANLNFNISTDSNFQSTFDIDGNGLQSASDEELSNYSAEMKALRDEYFDANPSANKDAMYLFVVPSFDDPTADGYMVRGKSMGFIKSGAADRTYAHELGHGFQLRHSFPANVSGSTTNLMDYSNGEDLAGFQWKGIRDFSFAFSFLDDAEDGASLTILQGKPDHIIAADFLFDHLGGNSLPGSLTMLKYVAPGGNEVSVGFFQELADDDQVIYEIELKSSMSLDTLKQITRDWGMDLGYSYAYYVWSTPTFDHSYAVWLDQYYLQKPPLVVEMIARIVAGPFLATYGFSYDEDALTGNQLQGWDYFWNALEFIPAAAFVTKGIKSMKVLKNGNQTVDVIENSIKVLDKTKFAKVRSLDELAPNGSIPPNSATNNLFHKWFDELSEAELNLILQNSKLKKTLQNRIRWPSSFHEWCMVCEIQKFKSWNVPMSEIHRFRTKTNSLTWKVPSDIPNIGGQVGGHGATGSTTFHNELRSMIQNCSSLSEFNSGLSLLINRWQIDPSLLPSIIN